MWLFVQSVFGKSNNYGAADLPNLPGVCNAYASIGISAQQEQQY